MHFLSCVATVLIIFCRPPLRSFALAAEVSAAEARTERCEDAFELARKTLEFVERSAPRPELRAELLTLEQQLAGVRPGEEAAKEELARQARRLRRRIILSHPALDFDRLLINKRPPPQFSHHSRQYLGRFSAAGPGLAVLESWKEAPRETLLLKDKLPVGSVLHPDLSFDGRRVLFSFCHHTAPDPELRRFFIYEIGIDGSGLRQLTGSPNDPMAGWDGRQTALIEDFDPCWLPDGGFAFVSTRMQTHIRCQYGGRYFANYVLYRADRDGSNIRRLSFNEAPEWEPSMLHDGRLIYTRWDYINRHDTVFQSLWVTRPDGAATAHVYGNYTRNPCMTGEPRAIPASHKIVATAMAHHSYTAGAIIVVDPLKGQDGQSPVERITPDVLFPETEGWPTGAYANPYPLSEDLFLAAYTSDPLTQNSQIQRDNAYAIYLVDTLGGRELIYRDPNMSCFAPIPVQVRPRPPVLPDAALACSSEDLQAEAETAATKGPPPRDAAVKGRTPMGVFYVQNVYQSTQPIPRGSIKSLRVVSIQEQPIETPPSRGVAIIDTPKRIEGTVPVGEDGSAAFRAPAQKALLFQLLDNNGMSVMSMRTSVYLQPGEVSGCVGCHESRSHVPTSVALPPDLAIHELQPPVGPRYEGGLSFAATVQPVLDRYCIGCHGLDGADTKVEPPTPAAVAKRADARTGIANGGAAEGGGDKDRSAGKTDRPAPKEPEVMAERLLRVVAPPPGEVLDEGVIDLRGTLKPVTFPYEGYPGPNNMIVSRAYESLVSRPGLVAIAQRNFETDYTTPRDYFAHASRLASMLIDGHKDENGEPRVQLDRDSLQRIIQWLDMNAPFYGDYSWNKRQWRRPSVQGEIALRQHIRGEFGAEMARQPFATLVNVALPEESRILMAPLAADAGGWGLLTSGGWPDKSHPGYQRMRELVEAAIAPQEFQDVSGTCGREDCVCDSCWVRRFRGQTSQRHAQHVGHLP